MTEPINTQGSSLNSVAEPTYQQGSNPTGFDRTVHGYKRHITQTKRRWLQELDNKEKKTSRQS